MSVRRLAKTQPASFAFSKDTKAKADWWISKYPESRRASAVIPILWLVQKQEGWVSEPAIRAIGELLGMPFIRVLEVATFYTMFQLEPVGTTALIQVCGTTPCMLRGAEDLIKVCKSKIHAEPFELNEDGTLSWEEVECQGACVNAPMVMIFKDAYEDLTPTQLEHIIDRFHAGKPHEIPPGPQIDRQFSAPVGGPVTLTEEIKPAQTKLEPKPEPAEAASAAAVPPSDAARPTDTAEEADPSIKTPLTDKEGSKKRVKAAEKQPLSATASTPKPDKKRAGAAVEGAPPEPGTVSGDAKPKRTRKKTTPEGDAS